MFSFQAMPGSSHAFVSMLNAHLVSWLGDLSLMGLAWWLAGWWPRSRLWDCPWRGPVSDRAFFVLAIRLRGDQPKRNSPFRPLTWHRPWWWATLKIWFSAAGWLAGRLGHVTSALACFRDGSSAFLSESKHIKLALLPWRRSACRLVPSGTRSQGGALKRQRMAPQSLSGKSPKAIQPGLAAGSSRWPPPPAGPCRRPPRGCRLLTVHVG